MRRLLAAACLACAFGPLHGQIPAEEYREAVKALSEASRDGDADAFARAFETALKMDDARAVRTAVAAYGKIAAKLSARSSLREFVWFHGQCAGAFRAVRSAESAAEFRSLAARAKDWRVRLLLLDASAFAKPVSLLDSSLAALKDESPIVVRRAVHYLRKSRKVSTVQALIDRYVELSKKAPPGDRGQWERTLLAFQSALHELLKVNLPRAADYKTYFESRKGDPRLFDPPPASELTGLSLFGAPVTGKNIIFVLDTSGSMLSTDPLPPGAEGGAGRGRTGVAGDPSAAEEEERRLRERERMHRAKKELSRVVRSLPSDVNFNIVNFDSTVRSWKPSMVPATDANKKGAVEYVEGMKAEGITVTDEALEAAFADLEVDTIYLLTDGAPTHVGTGGPGMPPDSADLIREIHERVQDLNFLRGVRVFTLGFIGAEEEFLKKLAADNAGVYVPIR